MAPHCRACPRPAAGQDASIALGIMNGNGEQGGSDATTSEAGTNVVRVPFGIRRPRRPRPARADHWATLVLSFQAGGGSGPLPPHAA